MQIPSAAFIHRKSLYHHEILIFFFLVFIIQPVERVNRRQQLLALSLFPCVIGLPTTNLIHILLIRALVSGLSFFLSFICWRLDPSRRIYSYYCMTNKINHDGNNELLDFSNRSGQQFFCSLWMWDPCKNVVLSGRMDGDPCKCCFVWMDVSSCIHHYVITIAQAPGELKNVFDVLFLFHFCFISV
jgi:hypothetical protein